MCGDPRAAADGEGGEVRRVGPDGGGDAGRADRTQPRRCARGGAGQCGKRGGAGRRRGASDAAAAEERAASLEAELQQTRSRLAEAERAAARAKAEAVAEVEASAGEVGAVRQAPALSCGAGGVHDMSTTCPTTTSLTRPHRSWRCRGTRRRSCERRSPPPSRRAPRSAHVSPETPAPAIVQRQ